MGDLIGAVLLTKASTGEILVYVSNPGYDGNVFYNRIDREVFRRIQEDPAKPLFNRAIQAMYPPSSVFKLVTTAAGLESARLHPRVQHTCDGGYLLGDRYFGCWSVHHTQNLYGAIATSCNVYFYRASLEIGSQRILDLARQFGLGQRTGIDLMAESSGFVPTREWKHQTAGRPWLDGDTLNLSIGQGDILVTPIQVNLLTMAIANEGPAYRPYLLKEVRHHLYPDVVEVFEGGELHYNVELGAETFAVLKRGMRQAVTAGTARACDFHDFEISGKTGTAQNVHGEPHAWFSGFVSDSAIDAAERVVVTVLGENAGGGGGIAAPIAARVLRAWHTKYVLGRPLLTDLGY